MDSRGGSKIAKDGFANERDVANKFINWKDDIDAQEWLKRMGYELDEIEYVNAEVLSGYKTDVQVQITIKLKRVIEAQNLQVKLVSNKKGYNQIDKRWVKNYQEMWQISDEIVHLLKLFTGEEKPYRKDTKNKRRMFLNEMNKNEQEKIVSFFVQNKMMIISDIMKGRGIMAAEWILVAQKDGSKQRWVLKPMNVVMNYYSVGDVEITARGSLKIGKITMQRKGRRCRKRNCQYASI